MEWPPAEAGIGDLSDDLLCRVFGELDSTQLRLAAGTCQRWAALLKNCEELWHRVSFALPPKKSRGRDRRNSYTTPCALNLERLAAWLLRRRGAIQALEVDLLYPDALSLLGHLLSPLTELRSLVLAGNAADWPYMRVDWRWLGGMARLRALHLRDALPGLDELALPPSLTELRVDRVGGCDADQEGWLELPDCFRRLARLQRLTLGTATTFTLMDEEELAFKPLRAARGLRELALPDGAISGVPDVVSLLTHLTLLSFRGCSRIGPFGNLCVHKADAFAPLAALPSLASLDLGRCDLEALPPLLGTLPALRTLLLADNMLGALRPTGVVDAAAAGPSAGAAPAPGGAVLPPQLVHLDLAGNLLTASPADALPTQLTSLDLSRCYKLFMQPEDWRRLLLALPFLCLLRHSDPLLMMAKPASGGLRLEQHPPASVPGTKRAYSCGSMEALEQGAAAALLGGGTMGGSDGDVRGDGDGGDGGGLAQLLAAAASSSGS